MTVQDFDTVLITDCGSTTTKAILVGKKEGAYRLLCRGEAPTTVEAPHEDVTQGVLNAVMEVEELTGRTLLEDRRILSPVRGPGGVDRRPVPTLVPDPMQMRRDVNQVLGKLNRKLLKRRPAKDMNWTRRGWTPGVPYLAGRYPPGFYERARGLAARSLDVAQSRDMPLRDAGEARVSARDCSFQRKLRCETLPDAAVGWRRARLVIGDYNARFTDIDAISACCEREWPAGAGENEPAVHLRRHSRNAAAPHRFGMREPFREAQKAWQPERGDAGAFPVVPEHLA